MVIVFVRWNPRIPALNIPIGSKVGITSPIVKLHQIKNIISSFNIKKECIKLKYPIWGK